MIVDHPHPDALAAFSAGGLAPGEQAGVRAHVKECVACRNRLSELAEARALCEEALRVRKPGDKPREANVRLCLATVELEDGRAVDAVTALRDAAALMVDVGQPDDAAAAEALQSRALLALGRLQEARAAAERAQALVAKSASLVSRTTVTAALARTAAALDKAAIPKARATLVEALAEAERTGVLADQYEARLAQGELDLAAGAPKAAASLRTLSLDARKHGDELVARRAAQAQVPPKRLHDPGLQPEPGTSAQGADGAHPALAPAATNAPERARNPAP